MTDSEDKRKHLEIIQGVINRMASNSFVFKGWSITIVAGLSAFAARGTDKKLLVLSIVATTLFWLVDAYYLSLERAYRDLYDEVARRKPENIDFSMKALGTGYEQWLKTITRPLLLLFYGTVLILLVAAIVIL